MFNPFRLLDPQPKKAKDDVPFAGYQRDPFEAVPVRNNLAECRTGSAGHAQLRMRVPPKPGLQGFLARHLGFHRDVRVDLDEHGSFFWSQVDGQQDLRSIERKVRKKYALAPEDSEKATIMFTKMLMLRHLIQLNIEC